MTESKRRRRQYTPEFKQEAVALVREQNYSIANAARAVDVGQTAMRRWVREAERGYLLARA